MKNNKKWTNEKIKKEIKSVMYKLNINRMPTSVEILKVNCDSCLVNAIRRNGGFNFWANKLNLKQNMCETRLGLKGELLIKEYLENKGFDVEKMTVKHPYDLLINNNIKIDVKTANKIKNSDGYLYYSFNLEKKNPTCDIYIFICLNEESIDKILIIPSKFLHQTQLCIGSISKYDKYKNKWEYVFQYDKFYKEVI